MGECEPAEVSRCRGWGALGGSQLGGMGEWEGGIMRCEEGGVLRGKAFSGREEKAEPESGTCWILALFPGSLGQSWAAWISTTDLSIPNKAAAE